MTNFHFLTNADISLLCANLIFNASTDVRKKNTNKVLLTQYTREGHMKSESCFVWKKMGGGSSYSVAQLTPVSPTGQASL